MKLRLALFAITLASPALGDITDNIGGGIDRRQQRIDQQHIERAKRAGQIARDGYNCAVGRGRMCSLPNPLPVNSYCECQSRPGYISQGLVVR